jgi:polysaccharide biosynthesis/export protein
MHKNLMKLPILHFVIIMFLFSSCVTQSKVEYLQIRHHQTQEYTNSTFHEYTLKPDDQLYIQISSPDETQSTTSNTASQNMSPSSPYGTSLLAHTVNKDGSLELPMIGKIYVKDKTISEVTVMIKESLKNILNMPVISIKLVNCYISILGEVRTPGRFVYTEDKLTVFDALSMAGDITDYGNRKSVILVRNIEGKTIRTELNLTKPEIVTSEFYYLQPNDMLYIKPIKGRFWGFREFPVGIILSAISTTILVLGYLNSTNKL